MMKFLEYRILKAYASLQNSNFELKLSDEQNLWGIAGTIRFTSIQNKISQNLKIEENSLRSISARLIRLGYLDESGKVIKEGFLIIHNYPKEVLKSVFTIYLPIILAIGTLVISIIALVKS